MLFLGRLLAAFLAVAAMPVLAQSTMPVSVEFTLYAPDLPANSPVYLSGGVPALGNWAPEAVPMKNIGNQRWRALVVFSRPMRIEYQYMLGKESRLPADERGQPLRRFSAITERNLQINDTVTAWTDDRTVVESRGQLSGDVRYHRQVRDAAMPSRDLIVWLPRFYEMNQKQDYPVLYLNDGQDLFDPNTAEGGRDWGVDEIVQQLINDDLIEPMIIVGISSTDDRLDEYSPLKGGEAYMDFVVNRVKPLIDQRYRTRPGRENTLVGGAAMGGTIAFTTAWRYPEIFGGAISLSPAFQLEGRMDVLPWFATQGDEFRPVFFYLFNGAQGADALLEPGIDAMVTELELLGYSPERNFALVRDPNAFHGIPAWSEQFPSALTRTLRGAKRLASLAQIQNGSKADRLLATPAVIAH